MVIMCENDMARQAALTCPALLLREALSARGREAGTDMKRTARTQVAHAGKRGGGALPHGVQGGDAQCRRSEAGAGAEKR
jgi:hypothetical protein